MHINLGLHSTGHILLEQKDLLAAVAGNPVPYDLSYTYSKVGKKNVQELGLLLLEYLFLFKPKFEVEFRKTGFQQTQASPPEIVPNFTQKKKSVHSNSLQIVSC